MAEDPSHKLLRDIVRDAPHSGDVHGTMYEGHRVDRIWAVVVVDAEGNEGLASAYIENPDGGLLRTSLVTSTQEMYDVFEEFRSKMAPPEGGSLEWREYVLVPNQEEKAA